MVLHAGHWHQPPGTQFKVRACLVNATLLGNWLVPLRLMVLCQSVVLPARQSAYAKTCVAVVGLDAHQCTALQRHA